MPNHGFVSNKDLTVGVEKALLSAFTTKRHVLKWIKIILCFSYYQSFFVNNLGKASFYLRIFFILDSTIENKNQPTANMDIVVASPAAAPSSIMSSASSFDGYPHSIASNFGSPLSDLNHYDPPSVGSYGCPASVASVSTITSRPDSVPPMDMDFETDNPMDTANINFPTSPQGYSQMFSPISLPSPTPNPPPPPPPMPMNLSQLPKMNAQVSMQINSPAAASRSSETVKSSSQSPRSLPNDTQLMEEKIQQQEQEIHDLQKALTTAQMKLQQQQDLLQKQLRDQQRAQQIQNIPTNPDTNKSQQKLLLQQRLHNKLQQHAIQLQLQHLQKIQEKQNNGSESASTQTPKSSPKNNTPSPRTPPVEMCNQKLSDPKFVFKKEPLTPANIVQRTPLPQQIIIKQQKGGQQVFNIIPTGNKANVGTVIQQPDRGNNNNVGHKISWPATSAALTQQQLLLNQINLQNKERMPEPSNGLLNPVSR